MYNPFLVGTNLGTAFDCPAGGLINVGHRNRLTHRYSPVYPFQIHPAIPLLFFLSLVMHPRRPENNQGILSY
jgi:hypothetical protein